MTKTTIYVNSFGAIRLLAAFQVVYAHCAQHLGVTIYEPAHQWLMMFPGVPIFFAISGYLVLGSLMRLTVLDFALHRAARIYPALIVNIAILELALHLTGGGFNLAWAPLSSIVQFEALYALTASWDIAFHNSGLAEFCCSTGFFPEYPSGVLWTLTVELTFYMVVVLFAQADRYRVFATFVIIALGFISVAWRAPSALNTTVIPYFWMFAIGMIFQLWGPGPRLVKWLWLPLLAGLIGIAFRREMAWIDWKVVPTPIDLVQASVLSTFAVAVSLSPWLSAPLLRRFDLSYGVYLYHMLFVVAAKNIPPEHRGYPLLAAIMAASALCGLASWLLIEKPAISFVRRLSERKSADYAVAVNLHSR